MDSGFFYALKLGRGLMLELFFSKEVLKVYFVTSFYSKSVKCMMYRHNHKLGEKRL
tara:strand:+ start:1159 stop:1326 length:168 start_codon:yes stop_codon:yes gene_type:complete